VDSVDFNDVPVENWMDEDFASVVEFFRRSWLFMLISVAFSLVIFFCNSIINLFT
jgi:hypothetical protein